MYLQTRYEKEGAIAAAVGCLLFQILTVMCIVFARTRKRKIVSFLFLAVGIAHFAALIIAVAALIGSLSNVGGHMF
jgi:Mg/Co/Ni transporter MgtE